MKSLLIATVFALGLGFPLASQAEVDTFGVQLPAQKNEVSSNVRAGYVAQNLSDTFQVQKLEKEDESKSADATSNYYVFGVAVNSGDRS